MGPRAEQIRTTLIDLAVAAGIGVTLALLGPFGSFEMPFPIRLAYWVVLTVGGYAIYRPVMGLAERLSRRLDLPAAALWAAACLIASLPMSALVWLANGIGGELRSMNFQTAVLHYGNVVVIAAIVTAIYWLTHRRADARHTAIAQVQGPESAPAGHSRFLNRLPVTAGRDLIALEMQDHYVMAHTQAGSALILMRMRDAIEELDGIDGTQVHRSWWVARGAVRSVKRDGRNVRLVLARGLEAPVARSQIGALQEAGWLG